MNGIINARKAHELEQAKSRCSGLLNIHVGGLENVVEYLNARDFAILGCVSSNFFQYSKKCDTFWKREYRTNPNVRVVFEPFSGRSALDGTVPRGFTFRSFVIKQTCGKCYFCDSSVRYFRYHGVPFCSGCFHGMSPVSEFVVNKGEAMRMFRPRVPDHLVMTLPCMTYTYPRSYGRRYDIEAYLFLARDIVWLHDSHPDIVEKRNLKQRRDAEKAAKEAAKRERMYQRMLDAVGYEYMNHPLAQDVVNGNRRDFKRVANIILNKDQRKKSISKALKALSLPNEVSEGIEQRVERFIEMEDTTVESLVQDALDMKNRVDERDRKLAELEEEIHRNVNMAHVAEYVMQGPTSRFLKLDTIITKAKRKVEYAEKFGKLDAKLQTFLKNSYNFRNRLERWLVVQGTETFDSIVQHANRILEKEDWIKTLTTQERTELDKRTNSFEQSVLRYMNNGEGSLDGILTEISDSLRRLKTWEDYLKSLTGSNHVHENKYVRLKNAVSAEFQQRRKVWKFDTDEELENEKPTAEKLLRMINKVEAFQQNLESREIVDLQLMFPFMKFTLPTTETSLDEEIAGAEKCVKNGKECRLFGSGLMKQHEDKPILQATLKGLVDNLLCCPNDQVAADFKAKMEKVIDDFAVIEREEGTMSIPTQKFYDKTMKREYMKSFLQPNTSLWGRAKPIITLERILQSISIAKTRCKRDESWKNLIESMTAETRQMVPNYFEHLYVMKGAESLKKCVSQVAEQGHKLDSIVSSTSSVNDKTHLRQILVRACQKYVTHGNRAICDDFGAKLSEIAQLYQSIEETESKLLPEAKKYYMPVPQNKLDDCLLFSLNIERYLKNLQGEVDKANGRYHRQESFEEKVRNVKPETKEWMSRNFKDQYILYAKEADFQSLSNIADKGFQVAEGIVNLAPPDIRPRAMQFCRGIVRNHLDFLLSSGKKYSCELADVGVTEILVEEAQLLKACAPLIKPGTSITELIKMSRVLKTKDIAGLIQRLIPAIKLASDRVKEHLESKSSPLASLASPMELGRFVCQLVKDDEKRFFDLAFYISHGMREAYEAEFGTDDEFPLNLYKAAFSFFKGGGGYTYDEAVAQDKSRQSYLSLQFHNLGRGGVRISSFLRDCARSIISRIPPGFPELFFVHDVIAWLDGWCLPSEIEAKC